jgi:hypothetical protein
VDRVVLNAMLSLAPKAQILSIGPNPDWHFPEKPIHLDL